MYTMLRVLTMLACTAGVLATTLKDICTNTFARAALPVSTIEGIDIEPYSIQTTLVTNYTASSIFYPTATFDYCNLSFAYSHRGIDGDKVHVSYWLPAPSQFENRYVSTGGGGYAINAGNSLVSSGIIVGGVSGLKDGGFGSFDAKFSDLSLFADGNLNWQAAHMFGYQAHHELATLGKQLTRNIYKMPPSQKLFSYFQGCSEGGREGWSQVQRFPDQFDGVVAAAPAFRWAQQQVNTLTGNLIEKELKYYPPTCEIEKVMNLVIEICDPLDGKADGIISRSDLCLKSLVWDSIVGAPYECPAREASSRSPASPAQKGFVTGKAISVIRTFLNGLHDSDGRLVYFSFQPGAAFGNLATAYNFTTQGWELSINSLGNLWVTHFINLFKDAEKSSNLEGVTFDKLKEWIIFSQNKWGDTLQTTDPDLTAFQAAEGKVLHVHGEQDSSIPTASSVRYWDSVRSVMFPDQSYEDSTLSVDEFYQLFLIPGAEHCGLNPYQPNAPWPQTTLQTVIDWVEKGKVPETLAGLGDIDKICKWPLRPMWTNDSDRSQCVFDKDAVDSFTYKLDAYKLPVY